jgi:hypothetical protein
MRRTWWLGAGVAMGVGGTLWAEQRVRRGIEEVVDRLTPQHLAGSAVASARSLGVRVRVAVDTGREARAQREDELWQDLGTRPGNSANNVVETRNGPRHLRR